jgi:hypothetical protein
MIDIFTSFWLLSIIILSQLIVMHKIPVDNLTADTLFDEDVQRKLSEFLVNLGYKGIYAYSLLQIKYKTLCDYLLPYVEEIKQKVLENQGTEIKTHVELVCKDGRIINKMIVSKVLDDITKDDITNHLDDNVELMIIKDNNKRECSKTQTSKICVTNKNDENINNDISNIRFIDLSLVHKGNTHKIDLKNDKHDFYVVNNKIDETFLKYYLTNILQINLRDDFEYKLQLLDHEVNISLLDNNHSIIIEKDGYKIENKNKNINDKQCDKLYISDQEQKYKDDMERLSEEFEKIDNTNF